jgi:TRAP transporter TAXI family solute receptor
MSRSGGGERRQFFRYWLSWIAGSVVLVALAWLFVAPAPPRWVGIATGSRSGAYYTYAQEYARVFSTNGIVLEARETSGSVENYRMLLDPSSGIAAAIVQGGTAPREATHLRAIASLFLEPVWVFVRADRPPVGLKELRGKRIAVGLEGSGTQVASLQLLEAGGVRADGATRFVALETRAAVEALTKGDIDAAFFVSSPTAPFVKELLRASGIQLLNLEEAEAYSRVFPFFRHVKLPRGVVDLEADLPASDVQLIAPVASLVVRDDVHPALVPLFLEGATGTHESEGLLAEPGSFPSTRFVEFPLDKVAREYFRSGPPFLQRFLPFWVAAWVDRLKIMIVPLLTILFPLFKVAPPFFRRRNRKRIYRWYAVLRDVEEGIYDASRRSYLLGRLDDLEREVSAVVVPLSYMDEYFDLRVHIQYVRGRLERSGAAGS